MGRAASDRGLEDEPKLVDYLLGRVSEREREELEARLFVEDDFHDELLATADDLIHAYLAGALSEEDRRRFETDFLASPAHRQRLEFVRKLVAAVDRVPADDGGDVHSLPRAAGDAWRRWALAAIVALAVIGAIVALALRGGSESPSFVVVSPSPHRSLPPDTKPTSSPSADAFESDASVIRVALDPAAAVDLRLSSRAQVVRFETTAARDHPGFNAILRGENGRVVWTAQAVPPADPGRPLVLSVPAALLASGLYKLRIEGESFRDGGTHGPKTLEYRIRVRKGE